MKLYAKTIIVYTKYNSIYMAPVSIISCIQVLSEAGDRSFEWYLESTRPVFIIFQVSMTFVLGEWRKLPTSNWWNIRRPASSLTYMKCCMVLDNHLWCKTYCAADPWSYSWYKWKFLGDIPRMYFHLQTCLKCNIIRLYHQISPDLLTHWLRITGLFNIIALGLPINPRLPGWRLSAIHPALSLWRFHSTGFDARSIQFVSYHQ